MNPLSPQGFDIADALRTSLKIEADRRATVNALAGAKGKILDHLHRKGESQRGYILFSTGIPEALWTDAIRALLAEGEIEREGEKRNTRYRLKERAK